MSYCFLAVRCTALVCESCKGGRLNGQARGLEQTLAVRLPKSQLCTVVPGAAVASLLRADLRAAFVGLALHRALEAPASCSLSTTHEPLIHLFMSAFIYPLNLYQSLSVLF